MPLSLERLTEEGHAGDFLRDLEVPVTIRFARKRMLLGDVAALVSGSVISLDQTAEDPIELLVNGIVIARGHVVNAAGNCAIRISELVRRRATNEHKPAQ